MNKTIVDFEKYLTDMNYIYSKKQGLMNAFRKIELWESVTNVKIENWRKEFLIELCKKGVELKKEDYNNSKLKRLDLIKLSGKICNSSYYGLYTNLNYINDVMTYLDREDLLITTKDFPDQILEKKTDLFTKQEIIDICDSLVNAQDRFIVYALFSGIRGNKYEDLVKLKVKDINFETKEISLPSGKIIKMDDYLEDILRDITDKEFGCYYYKLNRSGQYDINSYYKFNMDSEYVLKVKPTVTNNHGLGFMSFQGLQTRLKGLSSVLNIQILGVNVYRSGVISRMHDIKDTWSQLEVLAFLKENKYNLTAYETQIAYANVYGE